MFYLFALHLRTFRLHLVLSNHRDHRVKLRDDFKQDLLRCGFEDGATLGVAYSSGTDSTALLALSVESLGCEQVVAIHIDHGVREQSSSDAEHCRNQAVKLGVEFVVRRLNSASVETLTRQHGLEGGLRKLRYDVIEEICRSKSIRFVATGHQADDVLEGHLLALVRGSGLVGLGGPRASRELAEGITLLRPLLRHSRDTIRTYLSTCQKELLVVEDASNDDVAMARNRIRHQVLPVLSQIAGGMTPLLRSAQLLHSDRDAFVDLLEQRMVDQGLFVGEDEIRLESKAHPGGPGDRRALIEWIRRFIANQNDRYPPSLEVVERVIAALFETGRTRWLDLPGLRLRIENGRISVESGSDGVSQPGRLTIQIGKHVDHAELGVRIAASVQTDGAANLLGDDNCVVFDLDQLVGPNSLEPGDLELRGAREGDRFQPFGMPETVRLFRWLASRGIPRTARPFVPVVTCKDEIIWVVRHRRSAAAPISGSTNRHLCLFHSPL